MDRDECGIRVIKVMVSMDRGDAQKTVSSGIMEIVRDAIWDRGDRTGSYAKVHMKRCEYAVDSNGKRVITGQ